MLVLVLDAERPVAVKFSVHAVVVIVIALRR